MAKSILTWIYRQRPTLLWMVGIFTSSPHLLSILKSQTWWADPLFKSPRTFTTSQNLDGSATTHVVVKCTLADLARATNLRVEDAAFAMNECGLLRMRGKNGSNVDVPDMIVVTREMVEQVARERGVKKACLILPHVLL
jgi:hypothetical protein